MIDKLKVHPMKQIYKIKDKVLKKQISKEEVKHVAKLAHIGLSGEELKKFQGHLSNILEYVDHLNELDTSNVSPTFQVTGLKNIWREDKVSPSLTQKEVLQNAPQKQDGYFKVKKVL